MGLAIGGRYLLEKEMAEDIEDLQPEPDVNEPDDLEPDIPEPDDEVDDLPPDEDDHNEDVNGQHRQKETGRLARVTRERREANERARLAEDRARLLELQMQQLQQGFRGSPQDDNLDPDEKWRRDANEVIQRTQFQTMDMVDKNSYQVKAITSPVYKRWENRVEQELVKARQRGSNPTRENILKFLIGESAIEKIKTAGSPTKTKARVAAEKTAVPGGRSNVSPSKSTPSLKERLTGVKL